MKLIWNDTLAGNWGTNPGTGKAITPRSWQAKFLPLAVKHFAQEKPESVICRAIMGSGKSIAMAQLCATMQLEPNECCVISTSTVKLVKQLGATIRNRVDSALWGESRVGCYYTDGKDVNQPFIVACNPSLAELAHALRARGRRCTFWMPDEAHKTPCDTIVVEAYPVLTPERICGFTATPYRADPDERLHLFDKVIYDYGPREAMEDKPSPVVPWSIVNWDGGEVDLDSACVQMTKEAVGPGMFNAKTIDEAETFATLLSTNDMPAAAVHSRLSDTDINTQIKRLERGDLRAIVHVNMLQEGIDLPWLMWLCMRRAVGSRVRFVQESGRVLRSCGDKIWNQHDKTVATFYDPHDLFGQFSLDYLEVLGGDYLIDDVKLSPEEQQQKDLERNALEALKTLLGTNAGTALQMPPLGNYLRQLVVAFEIMGATDNRKIASKAWRGQGPTDKQVNALGNLRRWTSMKCIPKIHQRALGLLCDYRAALSRGLASDLMTSLIGLANNKRWPDFRPLDQAAENGLKKHEEQKNGGFVARPQIKKPEDKKAGPSLFDAMPAQADDRYAGGQDCGIEYTATTAIGHRESNESVSERTQGVARGSRPATPVLLSGSTGGSGKSGDSITSFGNDHGEEM
jgi:hypothetical protein